MHAEHSSHQNQALLRMRAPEPSPYALSTRNMPSPPLLPCPVPSLRTNHLRPGGGVKVCSAERRRHRLWTVKELEAPGITVQAKHPGAGGRLCWVRWGGQQCKCGLGFAAAVAVSGGRPAARACSLGRPAANLSGTSAAPGAHDMAWQGCRGSPERRR